MSCPWSCKGLEFEGPRGLPVDVAPERVPAEAPALVPLHGPLLAVGPEQEDLRPLGPRGLDGQRQQQAPVPVAPALGIDHEVVELGGAVGVDVQLAEAVGGVQVDGVVVAPLVLVQSHFLSLSCSRVSYILPP